jgi:hypothetical protein
MSDEKYSVGQIIYAYHQQSFALTPMQIVEETVVRTLTSATTQYKVRYLDQASREFKFTNLSTVQQKGVIYKDLTVARSDIMKQATQSINDLIVQTQQNTADWFGDAAPSVHVDEQPASSRAVSDPYAEMPEIRNEKTAQDQVLIELPGGKVGRVKLKQ